MKYVTIESNIGVRDRCVLLVINLLRIIDSLVVVLSATFIYTELHMWFIHKLRS